MEGKSKRSKVAEKQEIFALSQIRGAFNLRPFELVQKFLIYIKSQDRHGS